MKCDYWSSNKHFEMSEKSKVTEDNDKLKNDLFIYGYIAI